MKTLTMVTLLALTLTAAAQTPVRKSQPFGEAKGSNAPAKQAFGKAKGSNAPAKKSDVKLVRVSFDRRERTFELTFTNFGDLASKPEAFNLVVLRNTNLAAALPVLQPNQTRTITVKIERVKLLAVIKDRLLELGRKIRDLLDDVEVNVDISVTINGKTLQASVSIGN